MLKKLKPVSVLLIFLVAMTLFFGCKEEPEQAEVAKNETGNVSISTAIKGITSDHDASISYITLTTAPLFVQNEITGTVSDQRLSVDSNGHAPFGVMTQGQWRFSLKAFNQDGDLLYTGVTQAYVAKGTDNTVAVDLGTYTTGNGTLSISLTSISLADPTLVIQYMKPGGSWNTLSLNTFSADRLSGGSINYKATATLQTGPYVISFQLKSGEGVTVGGQTLNTHIFQNGTTRITGNFTVAGSDGNFFKIMPGQSVTFQEMAAQINISPTDLCKGFYIYGSNPDISVDFPYTNTSQDIQYAIPITAPITDYFNYSSHTVTPKGSPSNLKYVALGIDATTVGTSAFEDAAILDFVSQSPVNIGEAAFKNSSIRYINLDGTTTVGNQAFYGCSSLTSLSIPSSVTTIGSQAFQSAGLTEVTIPSTVSSVGASAFRSCQSLRTVSWSGPDIPAYAFTDSVVNTVTFSANNIGEAAFSGCRSLTTITFPEGTKTIGTRAFAGTSLAAVRIPSSMTSIGSDAFTSTQMLGSIHIEKPFDSIPGKPWGSTGVVSWANYVLTFEPNGSQQFPATVNPTSKIISYGGTYGTLPDGNLNGSWDVSRTGHTLLGWFTSPTGGTQVYSGTSYNLVTSSTVYAHWQANNYYVSFDTNASGMYNTTNDITVNSGSLNRRQITFGQTYGTMPVISKPGYTFNGWYTAASGGDLVESGTQVLVLNDQTLYAHWTANRVSVGFSSNLPITGGGTTVSTMQTYGSNWVVPASPTYTGYAFTGWTTAAGSGGSAVNSSTVFHSPDPMTVYGHWSANTYTVTLNTNATSLYNGTNDVYVAGTSTAPAGSITVTYDSTYSALPTLSKRGYTFQGWYTAASGGSRVNASDTVRIVSNVTYYAHWTANNYDVIFHSSLPSGGDSTQTVTQTYGSAWRLGSDPTYTGYTKRRSGSSSAWFDSSNNAYTSSTTFTHTSGLDVYARWDANSYTVNLNLNSDSLYKKATDIYKKNTSTAPPSSITVTYDSTYSALPDLTKAGYTFNGWYTSSSGGDKVTSSTKVGITSTQTLYAHWSANTYTATFTLAGGNISGSTSNVTRTQTYGSTMSIPSSPARTGYTFTSWKDASSSDTFTSSSIYPFAGDRTITATWTVKSYTTTYVFQNSYTTQNSNYSFSTTPATANVEKTQNYGSTREPPSTPSRTGYTFNGWYTAASGGSKASSTIPAYNETLYAQWTPQEVTVTYVYNDDTSFSLPTTQTFNRTYSHPTQNKTKTGMTFAGWYFDSGTSVAVGSNVVGKTSAHSIYARWTYNDYIATFNANSGAFPDGATTKNVTQTYASRYNMPANNPTKTGYTFVRWNLRADNAGTSVSSSTYVTTPSDHSVYAIWTPWQFTLSFDINAGGLYNGTSDISGSWNSITMTYDSALGSLPTPSKPGYTFNGWYVDGVKISSSTVSKYTSNKTAVASWTANTYTLTYDSNASGLYNTTNDLNLGGTAWASATKTQTFTYGQAMTGLKSMGKTGYTYNGLWSTSSTNAKQYTASSVYDVAGPMTVYAHWTANTYTLTYDANAASLYNSTNDVNLAGTAWGSAGKTQTFTYGSSMSGLKSAGKTGYTFNGWYTATSGGSQITSSTTWTTAGNMTVYGRWSVNSYTAYFNTNYPDGSSSSSTKTLTYGSKISLASDPSFSGYTFLGWYTAASGGSQITSSTTSTYTSNQTFYAHWTSKVITLNVNAGSLYNTTNDIYSGSSRYTGGTTGISASHKYTNLPTLTKAGHTFQGWYTAASGGSQVTTSTDYSVDTLYAHWSVNTYTVSLDPRWSALYGGSSGGSLSKSSFTVTYGQTYSGMVDASHTGYTFNGWYTAASGGSRVSSSTTATITSNQTLYAQWSANTVTGTFNTNYPAGSSTSSTKTLTYGSAIPLPSDPTCSGYTFVGWYTAASGGSQITSSTVSTYTSNVTFYAHWAYIKTSIGMPSAVTGGSVSGKTLTFNTGANANSTTNTADYYDNALTPTCSSTWSHTGAAASVSDYSWWISGSNGIVKIVDVNDSGDYTSNSGTVIRTNSSGIRVYPLKPGSVTIYCRATSGYGSESNSGAVDSITVTCQGALSSISISSGSTSLTVRNSYTYYVYYNQSSGSYTHTSQTGISSVSMDSAYGSISGSGSTISVTTGYNTYSSGSFSVTAGGKTASKSFSISGPTNGQAISNGSSVKFTDMSLVKNNTTGNIIAGYCIYDTDNHSTSGTGIDFTYTNSTGHTVWLVPILISSWNTTYKYAGLPTSYTSEPSFASSSSLKGIYMPDSVSGTHSTSRYSGCSSLDYSQIRVSPNLNFPVSWDSGGGTSYGSTNFKWGNSITSPGSPSYSGASFSGWYTGISSGSSLSGTINSLTASWTFYARYSLSGSVSFTSSDDIQDQRGNRLVRVTVPSALRTAPGGSARTVQYAWDGGGYSSVSVDGSGYAYVRLSSEGYYTLYIRVLPASGERATGSVVNTSSVSLSRLEYPTTKVYVKTGFSGRVQLYANRNNRGVNPSDTTMYVWASGADVRMSGVNFADNSDHYTCNWSGVLFSNNSSHYIYAYNYRNGYIDSLTSHCHDNGSSGGMTRTNYSVY